MYIVFYLGVFMARKSLLDWCNENGDFGKEVYDSFMRCLNENIEKGVFIDSVTSGSKNKAYFKCSNGHIFEKRIDTITGQKQWCRICSDKQKNKIIIANSIKSGKKISLLDWCLSNGESGKQVYDYFMRCEELNNIKGYTLENLTPGSNAVISIICENGHHNYMTVYSLTSGKRCKDCYSNMRGKIVSRGKIKNGNNFYNWLLNEGDRGINILNAFNRCLDLNEGIELDKLAINSSSNSFYLSCENEFHKPFQTNTANVYRGSWCPLCHNKSSYPEQIIYLWCKKNFIDVLNRDKTKCGVEADILIEDIKLIIEYNSYYYHKIKQDRSKKDIEKLNIYRKNGYYVLIIEDTYDNDIIDGDVIYHNYLKDKDCYNLIRMISEYLLFNNIQHKYTSLDGDTIMIARSIVNK